MLRIGMHVLAVAQARGIASNIAKLPTYLAANTNWVALLRKHVSIRLRPSCRGFGEATRARRGTHVQFWLPNHCSIYRDYRDLTLHVPNGLLVASGVDPYPWDGAGSLVYLGSLIALLLYAFNFCK